MKRKIFIMLPFLIIGAGVALMQFFAGFKTPPEKTPPKTPAKAVSVRTVSLHDVTARIIAYGRLISSQPVILYSEVQGWLEEGSVPFLPGQTFERGDLLIKVDDRQISYNINAAKSDLLTALSKVLPEIRLDFPDQYRIWEQYFNRCTFQEKIPDIPEAANQKIKLYLSRFNVYKMYFSIRDLEVLHEKHFFYAPFAGSIRSADLRVGSNVRPGSKLGDIINLEKLEAEMPVPAEDVQWINPGKPVRLTSEELPGTWSGTLKRIGKTVDTRTQTVQLYIALDNAAESDLYDGVFMKGVIPGRTVHRAITVPREALYEQRYVYVVENNRLMYRPVTVVRREPEHVIVSEGLKNGDRLVVEMLQGVAPGMPARIRNASTKELSS